MEILKGITDYIDFLRSLGYGVSLCGFAGHFGEATPVLLEYESHLHSVCMLLKSNPETRKLCLQNKARINRKLFDSPCKECCYAGVAEFEFPVFYKDEKIMCIIVSGFKGKVKDSLVLKENFDQKTYEKFKVSRKTLKPDNKTAQQLQKFVAPLKVMVIELYKQSLKTARPENLNVYYSTIEYINKNFMAPITCKDIAEKVNYSESYIRHEFKKQNGKNLNEYLTALRLKTACDLLKSTDISVADIALQTGFCNSNYFATVFKKNFGLTPKKYRKDNHL